MEDEQDPHNPPEDNYKEEFKERIVDKLSSQDTGKILYDLRTIEKDWTFEQSKTNQDITANGVCELYKTITFVIYIYLF